MEELGDLSVLSSWKLGFLNAGRASYPEVVWMEKFARWSSLGPKTPAQVGRRLRCRPETPVSLRGPSGQGTSTAPRVAHSGKAGDSGQTDRKLRGGRRLRTRAEILSMTLNRPETPVTKGRILRPPGDSGHPPVILRRGIQYRTTS